MHNFSAVSGMVSLSLEARNMQTAPRSCRWVLGVASKDENNVGKTGVGRRKNMYKNLGGRQEQVRLE